MMESLEGTITLVFGPRMGRESFLFHMKRKNMKSQGNIIMENTLQILMVRILIQPCYAERKMADTLVMMPHL